MKSSRFSFHLVVAICFGFTIGLILAGAQPIHLTAPEKMVTSLDGAVGLASEQKIRAAEIFEKATSEIRTLPTEDFQKRSEILRTMRTELRAMLTPQQWVQYALTPQAQGGGQHIHAENMTKKLDRLVNLTNDQKTKVREIFDRYAEEHALLLDDPESRPRKNMDLRRTANAQVRALLAPYQQLKFDSTPMGDGGGKTGSSAVRKE